MQDLHSLGDINVYVPNGKKILKELKKLTQLRKLGVIGIGKETSKEVCSAVSHLTHLESLSLRSEGKPGLKGCLDAISSQPPRYLQSLKLYGFLAELPKWIRKLSYLVKLNLQSTRLNCHAIEILGELPNLTLLRLWRKSIKGGALHFRGNFRSLVVLELVDLDDLISVQFAEEPMPNLELLSVRDCWRLDEIGISGYLLLRN